MCTLIEVKVQSRYSNSRYIWPQMKVLCAINFKWQISNARSQILNYYLSVNSEKVAHLTKTGLLNWWTLELHTRGRFDFEYFYCDFTFMITTRMFYSFIIYIFFLSFDDVLLSHHDCSPSCKYLFIWWWHDGGDN